ncbi:hypothetical protein KTD15_06340 [Burkholderia multivorans]|uniref:hypothetical protein n=1 Tax=Burkholderia multivorans TaxID=87883 RepID=UPI001C242AA2|nr:hypothetical protein [Burkholderia multivorans]MBU9118413.1 hypothetical protein [Burkholderia multivorans]MBU9434141.1 hypothetical protein [Burkholderia multivorans]
MNKPTIKEQIVESFGPALSSEDRKIPINLIVDATEIKDGLAYCPSSKMFFLFVYNKEKNRMDAVIGLDRYHFNSDMYYVGKQPHEYIETEEEYIEWVEKQRTTNPDVVLAIKAMESYVLNYKLKMELPIKEECKTRRSKV